MSELYSTGGRPHRSHNYEASQNQFRWLLASHQLQARTKPLLTLRGTFFLQHHEDSRRIDLQ